ncbi:MAG TPA: Fic family protein [Puia sp.]|jgi:Fic family protein
MAKQQAIEKELADLQTLLARHSGGASLDTIQSQYGKPINERTLQRRLATLQQQGIVRTSGQGRSLIYHLISPAENPADTVAEEKIETVLPLSADSHAIQRILQQPVANRPSASYDPSFLSSYRPNIDFYLTTTERTRLLALGQTAQLDQPAGTYARQILQRLLIDLSFNSSRLEGNTYSLLDTRRLLSQGLEAENKSAADAQMILNHKEAIEFLVESADEIGFNRYTITNLHALLSNNLLPDPGASGRLRTFAAGIGKSAYTPLAIPQQIEEYFDMLLQKTSQIEDPFEQAFFVMVHLPYLQPFDDVNKRVSRLAANIPLNRRNLAPLSFVDVPQDLYIQGLLGVYELRRTALLKDVFVWAYERSSFRYAELRQTLGEPDTFRLRYRDDIRMLVAEIIKHALLQQAAQKRILAYADQVPESDRAKFIEVVETELLSLHEGNFARYRIRPSEFAAWKAVWEGEGS